MYCVFPFCLLFYLIPLGIDFFFPHELSLYLIFAVLLAWSLKSIILPRLHSKQALRLQKRTPDSQLWLKNASSVLQVKGHFDLYVLWFWRLGYGSTNRFVIHIILIYISVKCLDCILSGSVYQGRIQFSFICSNFPSFFKL